MHRPKVYVKTDVLWQRNIKTKLIVARHTTRERWAFAPYSIEERGERNVPLIYLKTARWRTVRGSTRYFINIPTRPSQYYPVEFNHIYVCWCEIT